MKAAAGRRALISETDATRRAAALGSMVTSDGRRLTVDAEPRTIRERGGHMTAAVDVLCHDERGEFVSYACWDVETGGLISFSRNTLVTGSHSPRKTGPEAAAQIAREWLGMADLTGRGQGWTVTDVINRPGDNWIVRAKCGDRLSNVFVNKNTGFLASMATWRDWPERAKAMADAREGTRGPARRNAG